MKKWLLAGLVILAIAGLSVSSCVHKPEIPQVSADGNFPADVSAIFISRCATAGCHDAASYTNAADLLLDSWAHLFQGDINGAEVVPYSTKFSTLLYYVNTDSSLGVVATDPGHLTTPITTAQYMTLYNWIASGAPDKNGNIPFATNISTRQKMYMACQACDVIAVIDGATRLIMRYIPVGDATDEAPHDILMSSDGNYGYIPLYSGSHVDKIDARIDTVVGSADVGAVAVGGSGGYWSIATMSPLDTAFMVTGWTSPGYAVTVNTSSMTVDPRSSIDVVSGGTNLLAFPHGITSNAAFDTFYAALNAGNSVIKFWFNPSFQYKYVSVNGQPWELSTNDTSSSTPNPHIIMFSPDRSEYFVSCQSNNTVSVLRTSDDSLLAQIPVGAYPQEMDISATMNYLFVTCMYDADNPLSQRLGSVYVIDISTNSVVTAIYGDFYQPHGIAVDDKDGYLYVPSRNANPSGPAPHHSSGCGSNTRPAWYSVYNLSTLTPVDNREYNVSSDPYAVAPRFR